MVTFFTTFSEDFYGPCRTVLIAMMTHIQTFLWSNRQEFNNSGVLDQWVLIKDEVWLSNYLWTSFLTLHRIILPLWYTKKLNADGCGVHCDLQPCFVTVREIFTPPERGGYNCRSQSGRMRGMRNLRNMTLVTTCSMAEHQIEIGDPKVDKRKHQISEVRDNRHLYIKKKVWAVPCLGYHCLILLLLNTLRQLPNNQRKRPTFALHYRIYG